MFRITLWILLWSVWLFGVCAGQETCYPPGGVAGIVVATVIVTFVVGGLGAAIAWKHWTRKQGHAREPRDGQLPKQPQKSSTDFAFDNPYFRDPETEDPDTAEKGKTRSSINNKNSLRSSKLSELSKGKKQRSGKNHFMFGGGIGKKHRALDDSCLAVEPERTIVALRGHDFTGLGFNICGNMRDGILVKDVLHRGPASESGLIKAGDKIISVTVSFTNIVYEDALTILSYASPYDVQLEIERTPDKSRVLQTTPSGSKRLGSCSFNNSGQKLFHPLYRSQSIDDLTQIDKDTFPSHGFGPRRSQSVGVAAHKLAAHFKNSDSKLEDKERSAASVILSTTGSLNEKMLANVMTDGNAHKNGLQWEKRFEDTLENEDSANTQDTKLGDSKSDSKSSISSDNGASGVTSKKSKRNLKYLDTPHNKGKLETYKSPNFNNSGDDNDSNVLIQQLEHSRRAKTMAEASSALWQLDQSIQDEEDTSTSDVDLSHNSQWRKSRHEEPPPSRTSVRKGKFIRKEEDNDSDVSRDSLEVSGKRHRNKTCKKVTQLQDSIADNATSLDSPENDIYKQNYQQKKNDIDLVRNKVHIGDGALKNDSSSRNSERVYANNILNKSSALHNNTSSIHICAEEQKLEMLDQEKGDYVDNRDRKLYTDAVYRDKRNLEHKQSVAYANQREDKVSSDQNLQKNSEETVGKYHKVNGRNVYGERQKLSTSETFSQNYGCSNRIVINGEIDDHKNKLMQGSKGGYPQNSPSPIYQKHQENLRNDTDIRSSENKNGSNLNPQKFFKKSSSPAGMFTQINPFQQPARQKNTNFKQWANRDNASRETINVSDSQFPVSLSSSYVSTSDSTGQQMRRETVPESHRYNQRLGDVTKTVLISSFESGRSLSNVQNNTQNFNLRQQL